MYPNNTPTIRSNGRNHHFKSAPFEDETSVRGNYDATNNLVWITSRSPFLESVLSMPPAVAALLVIDLQAALAEADERKGGDVLEALRGTSAGAVLAGALDDNVDVRRAA